MSYEKRSKWYLILPISTLIISALFFLSGFIGFDFIAYYYAGKNIFTNPEIIYTTQIHPPYLYCPGFASVFSIISMFEFSKALLLYKLILLIFAIASLIIMDDILTIKKVDIKLRIFILLALNCGFGVFRMFKLLQSKYIVIFLILLFIRREITNEYNLRFFATQSFILVVVVSILPYTIFLCIIYIFHHHKKIFRIIQLKKVCIMILEFIIFNFMFLLHPELISGFLDGFNGISHHIFLWGAPLNIDTEIIVSGRLCFRRSPITIILFLLRIYIRPEYLRKIGKVITITALILATYKNIGNKKIEKKIGDFFVIFLLFSGTYYHAHYVVILSLVALLFTKKNKLNYIGIFCIGVLFVIPTAYIILKDFPLLTHLPVMLYVLYPSIFCVLIYIIYKI